MQQICISLIASFFVALQSLFGASQQVGDTVQELKERIRYLEGRLRSLGHADSVPGLASSTGLLESNGENGLFAKIQVAKWPFELNFEHLPSKPTTFYIEIGAHNSDTLVDHLEAQFAQGAFLITFEPLLDKYADLLSRFGVEPNNRAYLGMQTHRNMILPIAVGCNGTAQFHVTPADGCSSLLQPRGEDFENDPRLAGWNDWMARVCATAAESRWVPCVTLEHVIGHWLTSSDVEYLKVDTQGFDLSVVLSAGHQLSKLKSVSLEVQCDHVAKLYRGAPNCTTVYAEMLRRGFETPFDPKYCRRCVETEIHFNRPGVRSPLDWLPLSRFGVKA